MVIISFLFTISQPKVNIAKNESQNHLIRIGLNHPPNGLTTNAIKTKPYLSI